MSSRGFTLIEVLLSLAISSVLIVTLFAFVDLTFRSRVKDENIGVVESEGGVVLQIISQHLRNASGIVTPSASSTSSTLELTMPDAAVSPVRFWRSGAVMLMSERGANTTTLTSSRVVITSTTFRNMSRMGTPGSVRVELLIEAANPANNPAYEYERRFIGAGSLRY